MSLFSTFRKGENRVTASILAVLESLSLRRIDKILGALLQSSDFSLVSMTNQPKGGGAGVPDAEIRANARILIETKTSRNSVNEKQLRRHLEKLKEVSKTEDPHERLLVLTPDEVEPKEIGTISDSRIIWASFASLFQAIDDLIDDTSEIVSEREAFLLRELQKMFEEDGLIRSEHDTVVVAARDAYDDYLKFSAYVCQPNRHFRHTSYIAFYRYGKVEPFIPKIIDRRDEVTISLDTKGQMGDAIRSYIQRHPGTEGEKRKIMLLSKPKDPNTIDIGEPIVNDLRSGESGRTVAYTQGQRYTHSSLLRLAKNTSELVQPRKS